MLQDEALPKLILGCNSHPRIWTEQQQ